MIELAEAFGESISSSSREPHLPEHASETTAPAVEFSSVARYVSLLFVCLFVCAFIRVFVCLSDCLCVYQIVCAFIRLFVCVYQKACAFVRLFVCLSDCLCVCQIANAFVRLLMRLFLRFLNAFVCFLDYYSFTFWFKGLLKERLGSF